MSDMEQDNKHWLLQDYQRFVPQLILEGLRGSQSHGTFDPGHPDSIDDVDYMGIVVMPPVYYTGLRNFETAEIKDGPNDIVVYEIRKFILIDRKLDVFLAGQGSVNDAVLDTAKAAKALAGSFAKEAKGTLADVKTEVRKGVEDTATVAAQLAVANAANPPSDPKMPKPVNLSPG